MKTFLVIESRGDDAELIRHALDSKTCHAAVCENLTDARAYLHGNGMYGERTKYPFPDAVICGHKLASESCIDFVAWLKSMPEFQGLPVVILSGLLTIEDVAAALAAGVTDIRERPNQIEHLRILLKDFAEKV